jgi:hypothetical protein
VALLRYSRKTKAAASVLFPQLRPLARPNQSARRGRHFNSIVSGRRDDIVRANSCRVRSG